MNTNVNLSAPIGALAFLGTGFIFAVAALVLIQSLIVRKTRRARIVLLGILGVAGVYLAAIMAFSFASHEKVLARGDEKHFCELDCHLAYSVANVRQAKTLGSPSNQSTAQGAYTIVTIKTRFDETTIGPSRGNGMLYPNSRAVTVFDAYGNRYVPSAEGQRALDASQSSGTPFTTPLRPGESYTTDVAFDLPADMKTATVLVNEGDWLTHFIIGHENSPIHSKTKFQL